MVNIIQELTVITQNIRIKYVGNEYITERQQALKNKQNENRNTQYAQRDAVPTTLQKCVLQQFFSGHPRM